jgi:hypothetical protein
MASTPDVAALVDRFAAKLNGIRGRRRLSSLFEDEASDNELRKFLAEVLRRYPHIANRCGFTLMGTSRNTDIFVYSVVRVSDETRVFLISKMDQYGRPSVSKQKKKAADRIVLGPPPATSSNQLPREDEEEG